MPETSSDVVRAFNKKGAIVYKAETERGLSVLCHLLGFDTIMARDVFLSIDGHNEQKLICLLNEHCVTVRQWEPPQPKQIDVSKFTEF